MHTHSGGEATTSAQKEGLDDQGIEATQTL